MKNSRGFIFVTVAVALGLGLGTPKTVQANPLLYCFKPEGAKICLEVVKFTTSAGVGLAMGIVGNYIWECKIKKEKHAVCVQKTEDGEIQKKVKVAGQLVVQSTE